MNAHLRPRLTPADQNFRENGLRVSGRGKLVGQSPGSAPQCWWFYCVFCSISLLEPIHPHTQGPEGCLGCPPPQDGCCPPRYGFKMKTAPAALTSESFIKLSVCYTWSLRLNSVMDSGGTTQKEGWSGGPAFRCDRFMTGPGSCLLEGTT